MKNNLTTQTQDEIASAQVDMHHQYAGGSTGVIVSGILWLSIGVASIHLQPLQLLWMLILGGVLIHPLSVVLLKLMKIQTGRNYRNPLTTLAMESTLFMLFCMPLAYGLSVLNTEWFFLGMMIIIGGRYLTFNTLYGNKMYWLLGFSLSTSSGILFKLNAPATLILLTSGLIETCFGILLWIRYKKLVQ